MWSLNVFSCLTPVDFSFLNLYGEEPPPIHLQSVILRLKSLKVDPLNKQNHIQLSSWTSEEISHVSNVSTFHILSFYMVQHIQNSNLSHANYLNLRKKAYSKISTISLGIQKLQFLKPLKSGVSKTCFKPLKRLQ